MAIKNNTPLERVEQARFVDWLEKQNLLFSATAQSTYTTSWNQKRLNHATGLRKGVPDMLVIIPEERDTEGLGRLMFIEMKRQKGGVVTKELKMWINEIERLESMQVNAWVAKGADEAIAIVSQYLKDPNNSPF